VAAVPLTLQASQEPRRQAMPAAQELPAAAQGLARQARSKLPAAVPRDELEARAPQEKRLLALLPEVLASQAAVLEDERSEPEDASSAV
jgi:hypothetical protein